MGRKRKYQITRFKPNTPGTVSHERKTLVAEVFGEVNASGDIYIGKDLAKYKTVTYVFNKEEIESGNKVEQTGKQSVTRKKEKRTKQTDRTKS
ncbi:MAG: hypothetical protein PHN69_04530 [Candidatus Pacebacteria bacterium]|nr:hypothetical protein [Fermentimonas sp.]MDD4804420.1 hypothetical protein [Candidatus Paceibacterota bacterium]